MSHYIGKLELELIVNADSQPIETADGRPQWRTLSDFGYQSDIAGRTFTVKAGFVTDLESCPRLPFAFWLFGDVSNEAAVIHDYLYATAIVSREMADAVLREACAVEGVSAWQRFGIWAGVRLGGASHFGGK